MPLRVTEVRARVVGEGENWQLEPAEQRRVCRKQRQITLLHIYASLNIHKQFTARNSAGPHTVVWNPFVKVASSSVCALELLGAWEDAVGCENADACASSAVIHWHAMFRLPELC